MLNLLLEISDLHFAVGDVRLINGVSVRVDSGERLGIIGPNGSGKTTLFNCLSGFHAVSRGSILFSTKDITSSAPAERARLGLGRLFQNFGIFREMTVLENMLVAVEARAGAALLPWSSRARAQRAKSLECLAEVGLAEKASNKAGTLSGGQMRLLEISRLLAFGAKLLLLDEPTAGVSPVMKQQIEETLRRVKETGVSVVIIEHDIHFIQRFCDRVVVLDSGAVVLDGAPEVVRNNPELQRIYFGEGGADPDEQDVVRV